MGKPVSGMAAAKKEQTWRDHLARQASSGKSVAAFCRGERLSESGFYAWRNRLHANGKKALTQQSTPPEFVDLGVVKNATGNTRMRQAAPHSVAATSGIEVRIDFGDVFGANQQSLTATRVQPYTFLFRH